MSFKIDPILSEEERYLRSCSAARYAVAYMLLAVAFTIAFWILVLKEHKYFVAIISWLGSAYCLHQHNKEMADYRKYTK